ncbi:MAG: serine/threonine-protein kinase [Gemmatimonadota bacterium]
MSLPPNLVAALAGNYELLQEIGRGGMGIVYAGRDIRLDRLVAIKVLPDLVSSDLVRERFLREARAAARLSHPSIVPIYSADDRNGVTFLVMAFIDGTTLSARLRDGQRLSAADAVPILRDVALALGAAHQRGVVHRDIKPENILVDRNSGRAMVTDFGIARLADAMGSGALTRTGQVLGTVGYMSPEQVTGADVDGRSDLYSLGVVAFEALSGKLPFDGPAPVVIVAHATKPAPPLASVAPHVPAELCAVVDRCLAKDPARRYESGDALAAALEAAVGRSVAAAPSRVALGGEERILTEQEADRVWRRAAELQAGIDSAGPPRAPTAAATIMPRTVTNGFKLEHVRQAAIEAGISAAYVTLALDELLRKNVSPAVQAAPARVARPSPSDAVAEFRNLSSKASKLGGAPLSLIYEVDVPVQLDVDDFDLIAQSIRKAFGEPGTASILGRTLMWNTTGYNKLRNLHVTVSASRGRTHIRAEERLGQHAGATFGGIVGGAGVGFGMASLGVTMGALHLPGIIGAGITAGFISSAYLLARTMFTHSVHDRARGIEALVKGLGEQVIDLAQQDAEQKALR